MIKQKTTWVVVFAAVIIAGLTVAVIIGKLSGTEYKEALQGVGLVATMLIGLFAADAKKTTGQ